MSDLKSKLPDLKELGEMTGKLFKDIRSSVSEIIQDYKNKHPAENKEQAVDKPEDAAEKPKSENKKPD